MRPGVIGGVELGRRRVRSRERACCTRKSATTSPRSSGSLRPSDRRRARGRAKWTPSSSGVWAARRSPRRRRPAPSRAHASRRCQCSSRRTASSSRSTSYGRPGLARAGRRQRRDPESPGAARRHATRTTWRGRRARRDSHARRAGVRRRRRHGAECVRRADWGVAASPGSRAADDWDADDLPHEVRHAVRRRRDGSGANASLVAMK